MLSALCVPACLGACCCTYTSTGEPLFTFAFFCVPAFQQYIESLLRKYIGEYVACQMCRSFKTSLTRDNVSRLFFVSCQDCGSRRSVAQIRAGYHATTKADRRAVRNAT